MYFANIDYTDYDISYLDENADVPKTGYVKFKDAEMYNGSELSILCTPEGYVSRNDNGLSVYANGIGYVFTSADYFVLVYHGKFIMLRNKSLIDMVKTTKHNMLCALRAVISHPVCVKHVSRIKPGCTITDITGHQPTLEYLRGYCILLDLIDLLILALI